MDYFQLKQTVLAQREGGAKVVEVDANVALVHHVVHMADANVTPHHVVHMADANVALLSVFIAERGIAQVVADAVLLSVIAEMGIPRVVVAKNATKTVNTGLNN